MADRLGLITDARARMRNAGRQGLGQGQVGFANQGWLGWLGLLAPNQQGADAGRSKTLAAAGIRVQRSSRCGVGTAAGLQADER
jgi:hypothetical protein